MPVWRYLEQQLEYNAVNCRRRNLSLARAGVQRNMGAHSDACHRGARPSLDCPALDVAPQGPK